jgi:hypothetical protein
VTFRNKLIFYGEMLAPRPTPNLEDHPLSDVRDCSFSIFAATLHIWKPASQEGLSMELVNIYIYRHTDLCSKLKFSRMLRNNKLSYF